MAKKKVMAELSFDIRQMRSIGIDEGFSGEVLEHFKYALSDLVFTLDVETETGEAQIVAINGRKLGKEKK